MLVYHARLLAYPFRTLNHQPDQPDVRIAMAPRTILTEIPRDKRTLNAHDKASALSIFVKAFAN